MISDVIESTENNHGGVIELGFGNRNDTAGFVDSNLKGNYIQIEVDYQQVVNVIKWMEQVCQMPAQKSIYPMIWV